MNPDRYLELARRRLQLLNLSRGLCLTIIVFLGLTAGLAWILLVTVPPAATVTTMRVLMLLLLAAGVTALVRWPASPERIANALEARVPGFGGRLITWLHARRRGETTPLFALLHRQTSAIAEANPVTRVIPRYQIAWPAGLALMAAVMLGALLAGKHPLQLAAQRLWAGGLLEDTQPGVLVRPGDVVVRRGSDVVLEARARGFAPGDMDVHASFSGGRWERAPMSRTGGDGYSFVFVGVGEEIEYYVSARGLTSSRHRIRVADLPRVTGMTLTYRYPAWTGLAETSLRQGDVSALPGTTVTVTATLDRPSSGAALVVNGEARSMSSAEPGTVPDAPPERVNDAPEPQHVIQGSFEVRAPGAWHLAARHEGDLARISDSWLIALAEDAAPEVAFTFPGHDRKATPIEEVTLAFTADDDFGVESLAASYSVNGGPWTRVPLDAPAGELVLALEDLVAEEAGTIRALEPGDVISFYGEAADHSRTSRSALYFVDVRPFDMRYRESQQMGGAGPSEGGGLEMAERQRDILSATWNLINERNPDGGGAEQVIRDQAEVLAMLQRTLRDQVQTLITRSQARGLGREADVSEFLRALSESLKHMEPAAAELDRLALEDAVPFEQQALRHLVTAESSVRDVDVSLSRSNGRGTSGRSLGELVELEMDPQRNRYEVPQQASLDEQAAGPEREADWQRLEELAARQEQLGREMGQDPGSLPSRWEQARLQRELEEMRREFEARRARQDGAGDSGSLSQAISQLEEAQRALERGEPQGQREAGEALRRAAQGLREASRGDLEERLTRAGHRAANLETDQQRVMEALESLQQEALERARSGEAIARSDYAMQTFGASKRRMQEDLADLRREMTDMSGALAERDPQVARALERALAELDDARVDERLAASAEAFEMGQPLYVIGSESLVEQALERLSGRLEQARDAVSRSGNAETADPLLAVRDLRRRLTRAQEEGSLGREDVTAVANALARLAPEAGSRQDGPGAGRAWSNLDEGAYTIRGTADENTETIYRMTLERLDLVEAALERRDSPPIRAQEPRDAGRDSAAAARYFRDLSRRQSQR